jgi:hypothetical protein
MGKFSDERQMNGWYYGSQGQQSGPVSEMELRRLLATGVLTQQTLVWRDGMEEWKPVAAVPELLAPPVQAMQSLAYQQAPVVTPTVAPLSFPP